MSSLDDYIFREAKPDDIQAIKKLDSESKIPWTSELIDMFVSSGGHRAYVIFDDYGFLYGFAAVKTMIKNDLKKIVIMPSKRRCMLGSALLAYTMYKLRVLHRDADDPAFLQCLIDERNQIGTSFFFGLGFGSTLARGAFEGGDGYLFRREIPQAAGLLEMLHELRVNFPTKSDLCEVRRVQQKPR